MNTSSWIPKLLVVSTVTLWASAFVGIRVGLESYHPGSLALLRYMIASISMIPIYCYLPKHQSINRHDMWPLAFLGFAGVGVYNIALNYGELTVPAGIASFIIGTAPVITIIISIIFLKETISPQKWCGVGVSLIGMVLIAWGEHEGSHFDYGVLYIALASLMGALYTITLKSLLKKFHPLELVSYAMWSGTLLMMIYLPYLVHDMKTASLTSSLAIVYLGIFPAAIAYALWSYILTRVTPSTAATYLNALPIVATLLGFILLGEAPPWLSMLGGFVALIGAIIVNVRSLMFWRKLEKIAAK